MDGNHDLRQASGLYSLTSLFDKYFFYACLLHKEAIQEGHDLATSAAVVGAECAVVGAVGDVVFQRPFHGRGVVGILSHIRKGVVPGEDRIDGDLAAGHLEGKGAVAVVGHGDLLAVFVLHGHAVHLVVAVGGDGDGHSIALLCTALGEADATVGILGNLDLYLVGGVLELPPPPPLLPPPVYVHCA